MRILIAEDEDLLGKSIQKGLLEEDFAVDWAKTAADASHMASEIDYDCVVLDLMLPDGSGLDVLRSIRSQKKGTPVLILSAKDSLQDKSAGFESGADDYLAKPFAFEELLMRIRAIIRRRYGQDTQTASIGALRLDRSARLAFVHDREIGLTSKEFTVLELFVLRRGHVLSRDLIVMQIYSEEVEQASNVIDVFINKLRRKLETAGLDSLIETVRGAGYVIR